MQTLILTLLLAAADPANKDLEVLAAAPRDVPASAMLHSYLLQAAVEALERRRAEYEKLQTAEDARRWQAARRDFFLRQLGGLPERPSEVPAQVVGQLAGDGFRVEKVIYESCPGHHITALLYLPLGKPPYPAMLLACGHADQGKAFEPYQQVGILLARHGIAVLCFDPIGQGERSQLPTAEGKRQMNCVQEHTLLGIGCILLGTNTARYRIHDGMRSMDYLRTRPDIDPQRIGCAGNSGGGTETSYLMALDERIAVAAPGCYLTTFRRLLETVGPQDAEQNICGQIAFGMDEADYVLLRAPRPTLICAATRDATFDISGTWDIFREAKRFYARLGRPECIDLVETDDRHGFTLQLREATARWMTRWLLGRDEAIVEERPTVFAEKETYCTPQGQVLRLPGERTAFAMNQEWEQSLARERAELWRTHDRAEMLARVRRLAGIRRLAELPEPQAHQAGTIERPGYRIAKWILRPEPGIDLPALAFLPQRDNGEAYLYLHDAGKHADAAAGGPIEALVRKGYCVLAVDLRGFGELEAKHAREWYRSLFGANGCEFFTAYLLGRSLVGMQAEDVLVAGRFLSRGLGGKPPRTIHWVAIGRAGIPALHAAALEPEACASLTLRRTLVSWDDVIATPRAEIGPQLATAVHGALAAYDLPDLVHSLPQDRLIIENPLKADGSPAR